MVAAALIFCLWPLALGGSLDACCRARRVRAAHAGRTHGRRIACRHWAVTATASSQSCCVLASCASYEHRRTGRDDGGRQRDAARAVDDEAGLTSAVWANRASVDAASAMAIQIDYVRSYSIWRDLQVIWHRMLAMGRTGNRRSTGGVWNSRACRESLEQEI